MEQTWPHMEQICFFVIIVGQSLIVHERAVSGSRDRANCLSQSKCSEHNSGRHRDHALRTVPGNVRRVGRDLVGNDSVLHVFFVGQPKGLWA